MIGKAKYEVSIFGDPERSNDERFGRVFAKRWIGGSEAQSEKSIEINFGGRTKFESENAVGENGLFETKSFTRDGNGLGDGLGWSMGFDGRETGGAAGRVRETVGEEGNESQKESFLDGV